MIELAFENTNLRRLYSPGTKDTCGNSIRSSSVAA
jgi:hypothetical protein